MKISHIAGIFLASFIYAPSFAVAPVKVSLPQQKILSSENGRFVFGQISELRRDQFMLDTKTGKLWMAVTKPFKNKDGTDAPGDGFLVLESIQYIDINGSSVEPR